MSKFSMFKGLYKEAQNLEEIARGKGVKPDTREEIFASAKRLRDMADGMESDGEGLYVFPRFTRPELLKEQVVGQPVAKESNCEEGGPCSAGQQ